MSKKYFIAPYISLTAGTGGPGSEVGGGSTQSTTDPYHPMKFDAWTASDFADDLVEPEGLDMMDYIAWWGYGVQTNPDEFTKDLWIQYGYNTQYPWDDYFED